jgi:hypothetical protein
MSINNIIGVPHASSAIHARRLRPVIDPLLRRRLYGRPPPSLYCGIGFCAGN